MRTDRSRALAVTLFALAAVLAGIGNSTHRRVVVALAFAAFALGAAVFLRWQRARRATVFDQEDKTRD